MTLMQWHSISMIISIKNNTSILSPLSISGGLSDSIFIYTLITIFLFLIYYLTIIGLLFNVILTIINYFFK